MTRTGAPSERSVFAVIRPSPLSSATQARSEAQQDCTCALTAPHARSALTLRTKLDATRASRSDDQRLAHHNRHSRSARSCGSAAARKPIRYSLDASLAFNRRTSQATSGRRCSQRTAPAVRRSICGHFSAGIGRTPVAHWLTADGVTRSSRANAACEPANADARSTESIEGVISEM